MNTRPLPESLKSIAVNELNENSSRVEDDIKHLREWLTKQPHLFSRQDDQFLLNFLRGCKFSLQRSKEKLDYYYTARALIPEYFTNRDPFSSDIQAVLNTGGILPLSKSVGPSGGRVILIRWGVFNPSTMPYPLLMKVVYMIIDILIEEDDHTIVSGVYFLPDYKNFPVGFTVQFTPAAVHKSCIGVQSAYPLRLKGIDIINVPTFFEAIYSIIKPILTPKIRSRTRVYSNNYEPDLYGIIPQNILPKEYGGAGETLEQLRVTWKNKVESYQKWFKEDEKYFCDEAKRPEGLNNSVFGTDGAFRKLDID